MPTINVGNTQVAFSIGGIIALVVLILCIVLWFIGHGLSDTEVLGLIAALALARLT